MKKLFLITCFLTTGITALFAQKYMTRTGKVKFDATAPSSPERIVGVNNEAACILDSKSGDVASQMLIKSFKFEKELMEEHFNENYMESDKLPKADFKGKITNASEINFAKDGAYTAKVEGKLTIHGVTNDVTTPADVTVRGHTVSVKTKFVVKLIDYKIKVPSLVADKLSKEATVTLDCDLTQK